MKKFFNFKRKVFTDKLKTYKVLFFLALLFSFIVQMIIFKILFLLGALYVVVTISRIEKNARAEKEKLRRQEAFREKEKIINLCEEIFTKIDKMYKEIGYSPSISEIHELQRLHEMFNNCKTYFDYEDFLLLLLRVFKRIYNFVEGEKNKNYNYNYNSSTRTFENNSSEVTRCLEILGLEKNVKDFNLITKAYRSMLRKYHPDANKDSKESTEKSKEINLAFNYLKEYFC